MEQEVVEYILGDDSFSNENFNEETLTLDETEYENVSCLINCFTLFSNCRSE